MNRRILVIAFALLMCSPKAFGFNVHIPEYDQVHLIPGNSATPGLLELTPHATYSYDVPVVPNAFLQVVGFSFAGVATNIDQNASWWASDTQLTITLLNQNNQTVATHTIGGFLNMTNPWDFNGPQSTGNGLYIHGLNSAHGNGMADYVWKNNPLSLAPPLGDSYKWRFTFVQDTNLTHIIWKGISINFHMIPAPGGVALIAMVIAVRSRRRR